jgi:hypothetical protein
MSSEVTHPVGSDNLNLGDFKVAPDDFYSCGTLE